MLLIAFYVLLFAICVLLFASYVLLLVFYMLIFDLSVPVSLFLIFVYVCLYICYCRF